MYESELIQLVINYFYKFDGCLYISLIVVH